MREYLATTSCRMRFLREQLDDPGAADCGRCDNCTGQRLEPGASAASLAAARDRLERPGVVVEAKRQWPAAMEALGVALRGRIAEGERTEPGRAVARFSDLGFGRQVRAAAGPEVEDAEVPEELVAAAVRVLGAWRGEWPERPAGIVTVGSLARPKLVESFARRIGEVGKIPVVGTVLHAGPSRTDRTNSAFRLKAVAGAYHLDRELAGRLSAELAGKPLFLLDDYADSGWTVAVAGRLLRRAGAGRVHPLLLATTG